MFTVLIKNKTDKTERLFLVDRVDYYGESNLDSEKGVVLRWNDGSGTHFGCNEDQDIFVMNKDGQTVARYFV